HGKRPHGGAPAAGADGPGFGAGTDSRGPAALAKGAAVRQLRAVSRVAVGVFRRARIRLGLATAPGKPCCFSHRVRPTTGPGRPSPPERGRRGAAGLTRTPLRSVTSGRGGRFGGPRSFRGRLAERVAHDAKTREVTCSRAAAPGSTSCPRSP